MCKHSTKHLKSLIYQAALIGMERELEDNTDALERAGKEMDDAGDHADDLANEIDNAADETEDAGEKFEGLGTVCKATAAAMAAAFAAVSAAAIAAGKALVDMTKEGAAYADTVLTESTVTGIATDKLQEYMYAAELVDVSTDTLTKSMAKQIKSMKAVQDGTKLSVEAYEKLGVQVTNTDGTLRDSDTVYWEVIDALGKIENETERDALAMQILGKSAQELNPLIEAGAERMNELGEQAQAAGYVISDDMLAQYGALDDQLQYLSVGATAAKNALGTVLLPVLTSMATEGNALLGEFTNGILDANGDISKMSDVIGDILPKVLDMIMEFLPELLEIVGEIVGSLAEAIIDNLPVIIDTASEIIFALLEGLIAALPQIAEGALQLVMALVEGILNNLPMLLNAALQAVVTLATGIANALPTLVPTLVQVVIQIVQTLIDNLPMILDAALQLIMGLAQGILNALPVLIAALPEIINGIITFLLDAIPQIIETGIQLHELCEVSAAGAVAAHKAVYAQFPNVAGLCDRALGLNLFVFFVHIEIILHCFFGVKSVHEFVDLCRFKTCEGYIDFAAVQLREQVRQLILIPFTLDFVQRHIERLLAFFVQFHDDAGDLGMTQVFQHLQSLVAADHIASSLIPDDRLHIAELCNAALEFFVFRIAGFQMLAGIVCRRLQLIDGYLLNIHL